MSLVQSSPWTPGGTNRVTINVNHPLMLMLEFPHQDETMSELFKLFLPDLDGLVTTQVTVTKPTPISSIVRVSCSWNLNLGCADISLSIRELIAQYVDLDTLYVCRFVMNTAIQNWIGWTLRATDQWFNDQPQLDSWSLSIQTRLNQDPHRVSFVQSRRSTTDDHKQRLDLDCPTCTIVHLEPSRSRPETAAARIRIDETQIQFGEAPLKTTWKWTRSNIPWMNTIRRGLSQAITTFAISTTVVHDSPSSFSTDDLCHKLRLLVWKMDGPPHSFIPRTNCSCMDSKCNRCSIPYTISIDGTNRATVRGVFVSDIRFAKSSTTIIRSHDECQWTPEEWTTLVQNSEYDSVLGYLPPRTSLHITGHGHLQYPAQHASHRADIQNTFYDIPTIDLSATDKSYHPTLARVCPTGALDMEDLAGPSPSSSLSSSVSSATVAVDPQPHVMADDKASRPPPPPRPLSSLRVRPERCISCEACANQAQLDRTLIRIVESKTDFIQTIQTTVSTTPTRAIAECLVQLSRTWLSIAAHWSLLNSAPVLTSTRPVVISSISSLP
jgi:ferredoxin